jgi:two-component system NtrC family sensor kinase
MTNNYKATWLKSIKFRLLAFGITMSIVPLLLLGMYYMQVTKQSSEAAAHQQQVMISLRISNTVSDLIKTIQSSLETVTLVNTESFVSGNKLEQDHILYSVLKQSPHIEELSMVSASGQELTKISKRTTIANDELTVVSDQPEFHAIKNGMFFIGDTEISNDNQVVVKISVPAGGDYNNSIGGLIAKVSLRQVMEEISSIPLSEGSYVMLINDKGKLIGHSDYSQVLRQQNVLDSNGVRNLTSILNSNDINRIQEFIPLNYLSYTGEQVLGVYGIVRNTNWGIVVEQPEVIAYQALSTMLIRLSIASIVTMLVLTGLTIFFAFQFLGPVEALAAGVNRVKDGDLNNPIPIHEHDEIGQVITAFNDMTHELKKKREQEQIVIQAEKQAAIGLLAAGVAHEINNPMNNLNYYADDLLERIDTEDINTLYSQGVIANYLTIIKQQIERCSSITRSLLNFARETGDKIQQTSIDAVINETIKLVEHRIRKQNINLQYYAQPNLPKINVDSSQLQQMLLNLITNALDAMEDGGSLNIHLEYDNNSNHFTLKIIDTGIGIPGELLSKIYDPFFTTKAIGKGTGLGLAISQSIIHRLRGRIHITSEINKGTEIKVIIPSI